MIIIRQILCCLSVRKATKSLILLRMRGNDKTYMEKNHLPNFTNPLRLNFILKSLILFVFAEYFLMFSVYAMDCTSQEDKKQAYESLKLKAYILDVLDRNGDQRLDVSDSQNRVTFDFNGDNQNNDDDLVFFGSILKSIGIENNRLSGSLIYRDSILILLDDKFDGRGGLERHKKFLILQKSNKLFEHKSFREFLYKEKKSYFDREDIFLEDGSIVLITESGLQFLLLPDDSVFNFNGETEFQNIVPFFDGSQKITLPDGTVIYRKPNGQLLEFEGATQFKDVIIHTDLNDENSIVQLIGTTLVLLNEKSVFLSKEGIPAGYDRINQFNKIEVESYPYPHIVLYLDNGKKVFIINGELISYKGSAENFSRIKPVNYPGFVYKDNHIVFELINGGEVLRENDGSYFEFKGTADFFSIERFHDITAVTLGDCRTGLRNYFILRDKKTLFSFNNQTEFFGVFPSPRSDGLEVKLIRDPDKVEFVIPWE